MLLQMQAELWWSSLVETEQGKQVLVAKCAFSEQRNDSYVLAAVITGTLPRAELTETTECCSCSFSGFYEWSAFCSGRRILTTNSK